MKKQLRHSTNGAGNKRAVILAVFITSAVIILGVALFLIFHSGQSEEESASTPDSAVKTTATTDPTETQTEDSTETTADTKATETETVTETEPVTQSEEFTSAVGDSADQLGDSSQVVIVNSNGTEAAVSFFEKENGIWQTPQNLSMVGGFVGKEGVSSQADESHSYTPAGVYSLTQAFGLDANPGTAMDYFQITENSYWVDDANSPYYNQHIEGDEKTDPNIGEHLIDIPQYKYSVFFNYNTDPVVAGKGSAFFVHIGYEPTEGCVALPEGTMLNLLKWLEKSKNPKIIIK